MSAEIEIQAGEEISLHWISWTTFKIGSGHDCQVRVDNVDGHIASIRFSNGVYSVYNRSSEGMRLGDETIAPGNSAIWGQNEILAVNSDTLCRLVVSGDPAPCKQPADNFSLNEYEKRRDEEQEQLLAAVQEQADYEELTDIHSMSVPSAEQGDSRKSQVQLLVGLTCVTLAVILAVAMLFPGLFTTPKQKSPWSTTSIAEWLIHQEKLPEEFRLRLQEAEQAIEISDSSKARRRLLRLRKSLTRHENDHGPLIIHKGDPKKETDLTSWLRNYVNRSLAKLEK